MSKTALETLVVVLILIVTVFLKESKKEEIDKTLDKDSVVLAFGDSLTYGFGAPKDSSYPAFLEKKTGLKVINAGVNGELSSDGLIRLKEYLNHNPDLVILCHGGNDILQKKSYYKLKQNLINMVKIIKESGAQILLVGIPDFNIIGFSAVSVYNEVAQENQVMYEDDILRYIELHRELKSDYVHPNAKGYEMMADAFIEVLKDNGLLL